MELQSLLILFGISAAASMDSFSAVLAYSAAGIHIPPRSVCTLGLVSGGLLGLSVLAGSRLGALGAVAQIAGAVLLILLGAGKLAGSWLRSLAARLAEQGPYTFSAWDLRFMLSVYADPTRADADRSGDLTVREAALLAAVLSVDGIGHRSGGGSGSGTGLGCCAGGSAVQSAGGGGRTVLRASAAAEGLRNPRFPRGGASGAHGADPAGRSGNITGGFCVFLSQSSGSCPKSYRNNCKLLLNECGWAFSAKPHHQAKIPGSSKRKTGDFYIYE